MAENQNVEEPYIDLAALGRAIQKTVLPLAEDLSDLKDTVGASNIKLVINSEGKLCARFKVEVDEEA